MLTYVHLIIGKSPSKKIKDLSKNIVLKKSNIGELSLNFNIFVWIIFEQKF